MVWEGLISNFWTKKHLWKFFQMWICVFRLLEKGLWNWTGPRPGPFLNDFDHSLLRIMAYIYINIVGKIYIYSSFSPLFLYVYNIYNASPFLSCFAKVSDPFFSKKTIKNQQLKKGVSIPMTDSWDERYISLHEWLIFLMVFMLVNIPTSPWISPGITLTTVDEKLTISQRSKPTVVTFHDYTDWFMGSWTIGNKKNPNKNVVGNFTPYVGIYTNPYCSILGYIIIGLYNPYSRVKISPMPPGSTEHCSRLTTHHLEANQLPLVMGRFSRPAEEVHHLNGGRVRRLPWTKNLQNPALMGPQKTGPL